MAIVNTVIDLKDYNQPIQYMIDDGIYWELAPGFRKKTDIFLRKNEASFEDNFIQLGFPQEEEFYQIVETSSAFEAESGDGDVLSFYLRFDKTSDIYERKIYSAGEVIGQAGGFYGSLIGAGSLLLFIFSERLFTSSILRKIYQIDSWQEKEKLDKKERERHREYQKTHKNIFRADGRRIKEPYTQSEKFHASTIEEIHKYDQLSNKKESQNVKQDILTH